MKTFIPMDKYGVFADTHYTVRADSRFVAEFFEKEHQTVLHDIRKIIASEGVLDEDYCRHHFGQSTYLDEQNHRQICYALTREGFIHLTIGYWGLDAVHFKNLYARRFNEKEQFVSKLLNAREIFPDLIKQIKLLRPDAKPCHYSNELDILYRIVLGMTAEQFREANGLETGKSIWPLLRDDQIAMLDMLQTVDMGLLLAVSDYQQRKRHLEWYAVAIAGSFGTTRESVALLNNIEEDDA